MAEERRLIGEYLVEKGVITESQLREATEEQKRTNRRIGEVLVRLGFVKEEDIARALSEQLGFNFMDLSSYQIDPSSIGLVPEAAARRLQVMPLFKIGSSLTVAMVNPLDVGAIDELERMTKMSVDPVISTPSGISGAIERYYKVRPGVGQQRAAAASQPRTEAQSSQTQDEEIPRLMQEAAQASVIQLVDDLISEAVEREASDIHIEPQEDDFYCRYRVDGMLQKPKPLDKKLQSAVISRIKIMANIDITEKRLPQDGRIQTTVGKKPIDLRIATFPTIYGEHVSIRILDKSSGILRLDQLGFQPDTLERFASSIKKPYGIVLVTGPTGSGKTTTLYSALNAISDTKKNIITLEDPVEYTIPGIHQSQVNVKAGLTFATGLRSIVRSDPDIIMIGEIRDRETADIAIHAALTGHLVFSTLHTNDAPSACARLIDIGVEPYLAASSIAVILAQRLVRRLCPKCKKEYEPNDSEKSLIAGVSDERQRIKKLFRESGCKECLNTGFKGRTGIFEILIPSDSIKGLIVRKAPAHELVNEARKSGMKSLRDDGLAKVAAGITSLSEVLRVTEEV